MSDVPFHDPADDEPFSEEDNDDAWATGENCGRWDNGKLTHSCSLAGTEDCDFECPYRNSLNFSNGADALHQILGEALDALRAKDAAPLPPPPDGGRR